MWRHKQIHMTCSFQVSHTHTHTHSDLHTNSHLHSLDDLKVRNIHFVMLGSVEVLLGHQDALFEQVLIDQFTILLGNQHLPNKRKKGDKEDIFKLDGIAHWSKTKLVGTIHMDLSQYTYLLAFFVRARCKEEDPRGKGQSLSMRTTRDVACAACNADTPPIYREGVNNKNTACIQSPSSWFEFALVKRSQSYTFHYCYK